MPSEKVTCFSIVKVLVAFIGVLLITLGAPKNDSTDSNTAVQQSAKWYSYIVMAAMPIVIGFGNLAMGELRRLDPILIPFYSNVGILVISIIVCFSNGQGFYPEEVKSGEGSMMIFWLIAFLCTGFSCYVCW